MHVFFYGGAQDWFSGARTHQRTPVFRTLVSRSAKVQGQWYFSSPTPCNHTGAFYSPAYLKIPVCDTRYKKFNHLSPLFCTIIYYQLSPNDHYGFLAVHSSAIFLSVLILCDNCRLSLLAVTPSHVWAVGESAALVDKWTDRELAKDSCQIN